MHASQRRLVSRPPKLYLYIIHKQFAFVKGFSKKNRFFLCIFIFPKKLRVARLCFPLKIYTITYNKGRLLKRAKQQRERRSIVYSAKKAPRSGKKWPQAVLRPPCSFDYASPYVRQTVAPEERRSPTLISQILRLCCVRLAVHPTPTTSRMGTSL